LLHLLRSKDFHQTLTFEARKGKAKDALEKGKVNTY